jgi:hypothetical protein
MSSLSAQAGELKTQGVVEAAQDPNSNVTAQDVEKKIIEESRKAGVAAYHFDSNATAEEKIAQLRDVCVTSSAVLYICCCAC